MIVYGRTVDENRIMSHKSTSINAYSLSRPQGGGLVLVIRIFDCKTGYAVSFQHNYIFILSSLIAWC